jgi:hypothetical protein
VSRPGARARQAIRGSSDKEPLPCCTGEVAQKKNSGLGGGPDFARKMRYAVHKLSDLCMKNSVYEYK